MNMKLDPTHIKECISLCWDCRTECEETLYNHCLVVGGKHAESRHVKLMTDCIQICQTTADFMVRNSESYLSVVNVCADVCEACAEACEQIGGEKMNHCANLCRLCAQSCRAFNKQNKKDVKVAST
ncbi:MAG: four-helix bundle copper-binding protein [Alphaproteobacteria bacterium]|nr:four-helix bundle copper-binding protein [Alphaproteobacteria bacterium]